MIIDFVYNIFYVLFALFCCCVRLPCFENLSNINYKMISINNCDDCIKIGAQYILLLVFPNFLNPRDKNDGLIGH